MTETVTPDPHPEQTAALVARVRKMMLIAGLTTAIGIGALLVVIGYRLFHAEGSAASLASVTAMLPKGAKILSTGVAGDRLAVTLDVGGVVEIRTFDAKTLKPAGTLTFATTP
jgi:hypothetical protein